MIPVCRGKNSPGLAGNFTLRFHGKLKSHPSKSGKFSTRHLFTFICIKNWVFDAINKHLGTAHLHLPPDKDEMIQKVSEFELKLGMIQAFSCIDGTHIPLKLPMINSQDCFKYNQFYSINVQAICDSHGLFMDIDRRWPGFVHYLVHGLVNSKID